MATTEQPLLWCIDEKNVATKRGKVLRMVKERYLRDDLNCSLPECHLCAPPDDSFQPHQVVLSGTPNDSVYLVPSMEVIQNQMDALEFSTKRLHKDNLQVFSDMIIVETVWEYIRKQDLSVYNRLRALLANVDRRFVVFANEHHRDCFVQKQEVKNSTGEKARESDQQRNERAVAVAWQWYESHLRALERQNVNVLFLANSEEDLDRAKQHGVTNGITIASFLEPLATDIPQLRDLVSLPSSEQRSDGKEKSQINKSGKKNGAIYPEHLPMSTVLAGIKTKRFYQGVLRCNRDHWLECYVLVHSANGTSIPVLLQGREQINRAMDGDTVAIQILPKDQWKKPSDAFATSNTQKETEEDEDEESEEKVGVAEPTIPMEQAELEESDTKSDLKPTGRVVGIVQRNWRKYAGSIEPPRSETSIVPTSSTSLFVPVDRKVPKIRVQTRQREALMDKRILVAIDSWPADSRYPLGHYVRTLGVIGDKETETNVLLIEHDIPCGEFSDEVMRCLPPETWSITPENSKGRTDLRHLPVMSIDPPNCKDIDDALHARTLPNGNLEVGVHIADVTHFVEAGSPLDEEAADRGTSTYLVDRRLDMLPGLLTTKLCSLTSVEDHFAFSVLWELKLEGDEVHVVDVSFCKSIIRSVAALSYQEAQVYLDDPEAGVVMGNGQEGPSLDSKDKARDGDEEAKRQLLGSGIKTLHVVSKRLKQKRIDAGALTLASPEVKFVLDTETQNPLDVQMYALRDTNALVEELMLLANITVSKKIVRHFPTFAMLRRHPAPSKRQFDQLVSQAKAVGIDLKVNNSKELQESLEMVEQEQKKRNLNPYFSKMMRILCTRCMMPAKYFCSGEVAPAEFHHYGLAAPIYTHFTSPIRRYADVVVHRLLAAAIGVQSLPPYLESKAHVNTISEQLNRRHHAAQLAGRASVSLHTLLYFEQHPTTTDAVINRVKNNGVGVLLPRFGVEGMIFLGRKDEDDEEATEEVEYDGDKHTLTIKKTGKKDRTLQVFDKARAKVYVIRTFGNRQELKIELIDGEEESVGSKRSGEGRKKPVSKRQK